MASKIRGFVPLKEMVRIDSIYHSYYYDDHNLGGMVFDYSMGYKYYLQEAAAEATAAVEVGDSTISSLSSSSSYPIEANERAQLICKLLPDEDTIKRHTTKRFTIGR